MKFAVLNAHLPNYDALAALTTYGNRTEYCNRHGYDLHVKTDGWEMPAAHPVSWDRLRHMRNLLVHAGYDWVYCCGTDTLHTNMTIPLDSFVDDEHDVVASPDWCVPIQADSFLVRKSPLGIGWLNMLLALYPKYKDHGWVENMAMVETYPAWKHVIKILPQRRLNAYHYPLFWKMYPGEFRVKQGLDFYNNDGQWQRGDFLVHWPSLPLEQRIACAKAYGKMVVR